MPKPKTALELRHEEASKHAKSLTALRRHQKTPEGIKQAADSAAWSEACRAEWMRLEMDRTEIRRMLPRSPVLLIAGGRCFCEERDIAGREVKSKDLALDERRMLAWVLDTIAPASVIVSEGPGTPRWAAIWAERRNVPVVAFGGSLLALLRSEHGATVGVLFPGPIYVLDP